MQALTKLNIFKQKNFIQVLISALAWVMLAFVGVCVLYFAVIAIMIAFFGFIGLYLLGQLYKRL